MAIDQNPYQFHLPIIPLSSGQETIQTVNLRDLHKALHVGRDYTTWVKERIAKYGFIAGQDYVADSCSPDLGNKWGGHNATEYHGTVDMAKELAMVENTDQGRVVRRYFIDAEKRLREMKMAPKMPYFLRRMVANMHNVPAGHFSILNEIAALVVGPMEALGYTLPEHLWPDISEGRMFCNWLRKVKGIEPSAFPSYDHVFDDDKRQPVRARAYPNSLLEDVRSHIQNEWLPKHAYEYFTKKDLSALAYLPLLLPAPSAAA